ncbi:MAG: ABC transporter substrate-binding protein [Solirubrobacteraceae bacterium]
MGVGVLACALVIGACGGGSSSSGAGSSGGASAKASGPIQIAMIAPLTGPYTPIGGGNVAGAKAAVKQINAAGGVDGRKLVLTVMNDQTNPSQSRTLTKSAVDSGKYVAIIGSGFSSSALADEPLATTAKIPYISMSASAAQVDPVRPYVWQIPPTSLVAAQAIAAYMQKAGLTKVALLHDNGGFPTEGVADVKKIAPTYGLHIVDDVSFSLSSTDFTSELTSIKGSGANTVWLWNVTPQAITVTKQFRQLGLPQQLVLTHGNPTPQYLQPACPQDNGAIIASTFAQVASPAVSSSTLSSSVPSKTLAEQVNQLLGKAANQFSYDGYTGVLFLTKAMKSDGVSHAGIAKALGNATYTGPEGVYHYSSTNHAGIGADSIVVEKIKNCKLSVVSH